MGRHQFLNNAFLGLILFATACATPKPVFDCKRDVSYTRKLDRVLIVSYNEELADDNLRRHFCRSTTGEMVILLNKRGVQTHVTSPNPKDLDPDAQVLQAIIRYQPQQILYFGPTKVRNNVVVSRNLYNFNTRVTRIDVGKVVFAAKLLDVPTHRTVWRGEMSYWFEPEAEEVAAHLLEKLAADNLLPGGQ
jgi:hypothetical protein